MGIALIELRRMKQDETKLNRLQLCIPASLTWKKKGEGGVEKRTFSIYNYLFHSSVLAFASRVGFQDPLSN